MPVSDLSGKKCFVTGAASGIGRATARALAKRGGLLFLTDIDAEKLETAAKEIRAEGGQVVLHAALDVCDHEAVRALGSRIHEAHGALDVILNIAGVSVWGTVDQLEHRHWKRAVDVNLMGPIHVIETFVPEMIRAGRGGHLVNVSSAAGLLGLPWHAAYSASKFGLRGISEVLRFDLARHGIGVSLVCPGAVDTGLVHTIEVVGIDRSHPDVERMRSEFRKHAITPERAAQAIVRGIENNRYLVFTSLDIRAAHLLQRFFPAGYAYVMRRLNDRLHRVGAAAKLLVLALALLANACSGSDDAAGAGGSGGKPPFDLDVFVCPGGSIAEGMNELAAADDLDRTQPSTEFQRERLGKM